MEHVLTFASVLLGGGILTLVQYLINRHDQKIEKKSGILQAIESLRADVSKIEDTLRADVSKIDDKLLEMVAVSARVRIIRFADEMGRDERHSKESWDQVIVDVKTYEDFCNEHPKFPNGKTVETIKYIRSNYAERLEKHDFL